MGMDVFDLYAKIGLDTSEYDKGLTTAGAKLQGLGGTIERGVGTAVKGISMAMAGATAAAGAFTAAAVQTGLSFDASMSNVRAISGATEEEFGKLTAKAEEMGAKTKYTATEMADAMGYMAMAGWKTNDMLAGLEGITNLATASGSDLATTSDIVTDALTAFGLSAQDASHFADVLATTSTNANTNVQLMGETFKYVAPVAGSLGYSIEDVSLAIGLMANSGIKASTAGTSLRGLFTRLAKQPKEAAAAMSALGISMEDGQGNMLTFRELLKNIRDGFNNDLKVPAEEATEMFAALDQQLENGEITQKQYDKEVETLTKRIYGATGALKAQYGAMLAGTNGMSGLLALVNASDEDFDKLAEAIDNCEGSTSDMAKIMGDNLQGNLAILKSSFEALQIAISRKVTPAISDFVKLGAKELSGFADAFREGGFEGLVDAAVKALTVDLPAEIKKKLAGGKHDILYSLFSTGSTGFNNFVEGLGKAFVSLKEKLSEFTSSQKFMDFLARLRESTDTMTADRIATLLTGIGEGILKIAEAVINFVNSDKVMAFFNGIAEWIDKNGVDGIADTVKDIADALFDLWAASKVLGVLTSLGNGLLFLGGAARDLKSLGDALNGLKAIDVASKFAPLADIGLDFAAGAINVAKYGDVAGSIASAPSLAAAAGSIATTLVSAVVTAIAGLEAGKAIGAALFPDDADLYASYSGISGSLKLLGDTAVAAKDAFIMLGEDIGDGLSKAAQGIGLWIDQTKESLAGTWDDIKGGAALAMTDMAATVDAGISDIKGILEMAGTILSIPWQFIWENFGKDIAAAFKLWGEDIYNGFLALGNYETELVTPVLDRIKTGFSSMCEDAKGALDLFGQDVDEKLMAFAGMVDDFFTPKIEAMKEGFVTMCEDARGAFQLWGEDIDNGIMTFAGLVDETFSPKLEKIKEDWSTMCEDTKGALALWGEDIDAKLTEVAGFFDRLWDDIKNGFSAAWEWLKSSFVLPHITFDGEWDLKNGKTPKMKVDWYAKAMENAMILNSPTIFGAAGGRLLGGGEAGAEVVSGAGTLMKMIRGAVNSAGAQNITVVMELDKTQLGKVVYRLNNEETQRVGVRLANV